MSDAAIFIAIFGGLFILRIIAATVVFFWILPRGDRCPNCDAVTLRVQSRGWNTLMPWLRPSWCYRCNWDGMLRHGELTPPPANLPANPHVARQRMRTRERSRVKQRDQGPGTGNQGP